MTAPDWLAPCVQQAHLAYQTPLQAPLQAHLQEDVLTLSLGQSEGGALWRIETLDALSAIFDALAVRPHIRVLVLELGTPAAATAATAVGALDTAHWQTLLQTDPARAHQGLQRLHRWRTQQLSVLPQAVLTLVHGHCGAAALALIEGSDVALATPDAMLHVDASDVALLGAATEAAFAGTDATPHDTPLHPLQPQRVTAAQAHAKAWISFVVSADALTTQAQALINTWREKDPLALQFTKETLAHAGAMGWDASVSFTAAKFAEIKARQAAEGGASARASAIAGFLAGQSKPGLKA